MTSVARSTALGAVAARAASADCIGRSDARSETTYRMASAARATSNSNVVTLSARSPPVFGSDMRRFPAAIRTLAHLRRRENADLPLRSHKVEREFAEKAAGGRFADGPECPATHRVPHGGADCQRRRFEYCNGNLRAVRS